jgi:eukaryotic-like serine/threonine-protein kinase
MNDRPRKSPAPEAQPAPRAGTPSQEAVTLIGGAPTANPLPAGIGEYRVLRKLGEGGMGAVYLAEDAALGRKVALKTMKRELAADRANRDRFAREARAAAAVEHDNIVPIWQIGAAADGTPYIAMPFLQGEMLDARVKRDRAPDLELVLLVARDVADGLAAAHAAGLVHRDIKPGNIWLEGDPDAPDPAKRARRAKVLDFGLARFVTPGATEITATGEVLGTPAYMAPEQARGAALDHRADLWSLGVTLYRMATGRLPFTGADAMALLFALASEAPLPVAQLNPHLPPALAALIDQLLEKDPNERPQTAGEVAARVRALVAERHHTSLSRPMPVIVLPDAPPNPWDDLTALEPAPRADEPEPEPRKPTGGRGLLIGAAGAALALVALLVVVLRIETADGTLVVEIGDPDVEAKFKNGKLILAGPDGKPLYTVAPSDKNTAVAPGEYKLRVEGADGLAVDTPELTIRKGAEVRVRVTLAPKVSAKTEPPKKGTHTDQPPAGDPDRAAAEWVLKAGGKVRVVGSDRDIAAKADLPTGAFALRRALLTDSKAVTPEGLALLARCRALDEFDAPGSNLTDAALLRLAGAPVKFLNVYSTALTGDGLAVLKELPHLLGVHLEFSRVTDKSMVHFAGLRLQGLFLSGTELTDEGLTALEALVAPQYVGFVNTKVTEAGVKRFAQAHPACRIDWNGGNIDPQHDPDRAAAEWVLKVGGSAFLSDGTVANTGPLPVTMFRLTGIGIPSTANVTDADLERFARCRYLRQVGIDAKGISDAGVAHFVNSKELKALGTPYLEQVTDATPELFKNHELHAVNFGGTKVTDAGFAHIRHHKRLNTVVLEHTTASAAALKQLAELPRLQLVRIDGVTKPEVDAFVKARPRCHLFWNGNELKPSEPPDPDRTAAKWALASGGTVRVRAAAGDITKEADLPAGRIDVHSISFEGAARAPDPSAMARYAECERLEWFGASRTKMTDAALAPLRHATLLRTVLLNGTPATDEGLAHLARLPKLATLGLDRTKVTDEGLAQFKDLTELSILNLQETAISDESVPLLSSWKKLRLLDVRGSRITDAGAAQLRRTLPGCEILSGPK